MFKVYIKLSESYELKHKNSIFMLELDLYYEHMREKEYVMKEFRKSKHDLKHQLIYLLQLTENREYEQLENYLRKLIDLKPLEEFLIANTENSLIDALVNYKYGVAKRYGITFVVKLEVPTSLPFDSSDLCVILGNAIDNAIEANLRGEIQNPYIDLKIKFDGDNLIILLENSFDGSIIRNRHGEVVTRKQEKENHGIGLISIQNVIEKYHGFFNTKIIDNTYKTQIILYSSKENG
ncbi:MAG: sensor histidine kinase [Lachnospiraceae bacterium]|nr:sensor histidine kinase [Lachnospiraceae bacterium]